MNQYLTWAEIDLNAIRHNYRVLQRLAGKAKILAVVKADAYGHGMVEVASLLQRQGVGWFGVSDIFEGIRLRQAGIRKPILLFESTLSAHAKPIIDYTLIPTVCTWELASSLNRYAQKVKKKVNVHVKVDTGMGRLGVGYAQAPAFILGLRRLRNLRLEGVYTHFPVADTDRRFTHRQIRQLADLIEKLKKNGIRLRYVHAANSMGLAGYKAQILNLVRPGLMLYGLYPRPELEKKVSLRPVMSVHSRIIFLQKIEKGRSISYGRMFIAPGPMTVATLPIGYSDGYLRGLSGRAFVLVEGRRCPVLGRVTMDQTVVDVSKVRKPRLGMPVVILGKQRNAEISADDIARAAGTISYEIVCSLGSRLPHVYKD